MKITGSLNLKLNCADTLCLNRSDDSIYLATNTREGTTLTPKEAVNLMKALDLFTQDVKNEA